jgi:hypothetical protein
MINFADLYFKSVAFRAYAPVLLELACREMLPSVDANEDDTVEFG